MSQEVLTGQSEIDNAVVAHSFDMFAGEVSFCCPSAFTSERRIYVTSGCSEKK